MTLSFPFIKPFISSLAFHCFIGAGLVGLSFLPKKSCRPIQKTPLPSLEVIFTSQSSPVTSKTLRNLASPIPSTLRKKFPQGAARSKSRTSPLKLLDPMSCPQNAKKASNMEPSLSLGGPVLSARKDVTEVAGSGAYIPSPPYPLAARKRKMSGVVKVNFGLSPQGEVIQAEVIQSSTFMVLDEAALKSVKTWRFPQEVARSHPLLTASLRFILTAKDA